MKTFPRRIVFLFGAVSGFASLVFAAPSNAVNAPGAPGAASVWATADKSFLGTAASDTSRVYFTGAHGIVTEVFYPTVDQPQTVDLQFLVGDAAKTWVDEEKLQQNTVTRPNPRTLLWQVVTTQPAHDWRITKRIFSDTSRNVLIQRVTFEALNGKSVGQFNLYLLHNPSMNGTGWNDASRSLASQGKTLLVAAEDSRASALGVSVPWKNGMASSGFVGQSDGWTDLLGGTADKAMDWLYDTASQGNVAQMGWVDLGSPAATRVRFDVILGFGTSENEAAAVTAAALNSDLAAVETAYGNEWAAYSAGLDNQGGRADDQYYLAAMVLKSSQDKSNGAMVAGLGTPWGETNGDGNGNNHGYHLVWARDLFKFANALINAGDTATSNRAVDYLFQVQMNPADGRFPQNSWVNGQAYWNATQMDEQAMPIILAWRLGRNDLWPQLRKTGDFIANNGPRTQQERWEENGGYSPSTIAAEIAGLICAAEIAQANGDTRRANAYRTKADEWRSQVDNWTFTTTGPHGDGRYYIRISDDTDPNSGTIRIGNGGGSHEERAIVDGGFLELVRMGVKAANDPRILDSLPEYDAVLKQRIPGKGDAWFRYNCDGYGERNDGSNYDIAGKGRLWPIFTAERGMYEIHRTAGGAAGTAYLDMLRAFSSDTGMISEQVWNHSGNVGGCDVQTPAPYTAGTATKSIRPLNWAMGEYISLIASIRANRIIDVPEPVCRRYGTCVPQPPAAACPDGQPVYVDTSKAIAGQSVEVCYAALPLAAGSSLKLHWGINGWQGVTDTPMNQRTANSWWATLPLPCSSHQLDFVFTDGSGTWDNNNRADWHQPVAAAPPGSCGGAITVSFKVDNATTQWGQNVYVVGDHPLLGAWNTNNAVKMAPCNYPSWCASIPLPANAGLQFKFIKRDLGPVVWESGNNRTFQTPATGTGDYPGGNFR